MTAFGIVGAPAARDTFEAPADTFEALARPCDDLPNGTETAAQLDGLAAEARVQAAILRPSDSKAWATIARCEARSDWRRLSQAPRGCAQRLRRRTGRGQRGIAASLDPGRRSCSQPADRAVQRPRARPGRVVSPGGRRMSARRRPAHHERGQRARAGSGGDCSAGRRSIDGEAMKEHGRLRERA